MRVRGRHYLNGTSLEIEIEAGVIEAITPIAPDPALPWVAPAFFDLQINGCDGFSFNSPRLTPGDIRHVADVCRQHGMAAFCPTLVTASREALTHGLSTLRQACETDPLLNQAIPAIHVEGPFISPEDGPRGAHPRQHVRPPDWNEFQRWQEAAGGRIRLVTLAPEVEGAIPFLEKLVQAGVVVALGHTAAKREHIQAAIAAGARLSTHLGNGSHALLPRHDNYPWEQLAADELWASLICDGHHLPRALVKSFLRIKTPARVILTCDAGSLAGLPPGRYREWDQDFEIVPPGKIVVPGTSFLGGSWAFTDVCVSNVLQYAEVTLAEAFDMAGARPRALLGLPARTVDVGQPADLLLFDWQPGQAIAFRQMLYAA